MPNYTLRIKTVSYSYIPSDVSINLTCYLSDSMGNAFLTTSDSIDTFLVSTTKSSLPALPADYENFFIALAEEKIADKYTQSVSGSILKGQTGMSNVTTEKLLTGMTISTGFAEQLFYNGVLARDSNVITSVSSTAGLQIGMPISGTNIPSNTKITAFSDADFTITMSNPATVALVHSSTAVITNGSTSVTGLDATASLTVGMAVVGTGIPAGTVIATIVSSSAITLSLNATISATETLVFSTPVVTALTIDTGIPDNTLVSTITGVNSLTMSQAATADLTSYTFTFNTDSWVLNTDAITDFLGIVDLSAL